MMSNGSWHWEPKQARPVAELVKEKTGGYPFFAIQFFTALAEDSLFTGAGRPVPGLLHLQ
jgi:predicted ATPase